MSACLFDVIKCMYCRELGIDFEWRFKQDFEEEEEEIATGLDCTFNMVRVGHF